MPSLRVIQLKCNQTEDIAGPDEPYMRFNGIVVWGPVSMNNGQSHNLTTIPLLPFFGLGAVELFDQDIGGFLWDPDDFLGAIPVTASLIGLGIQVGSFTGDGANYQLFYEVVP